MEICSTLWKFHSIFLKKKMGAMNFEKLSSAQHAYCIWLCWLLVRKIDIDRLAFFPLHRIDYFPFSKLDYRNKTQYSHRQEGECMMDAMVERLMHVELVLEFKQVEFVLN